MYSIVQQLITISIVSILLFVPDPNFLTSIVAVGPLIIVLLDSPRPPSFPVQEKGVVGLLTAGLKVGY